MSKMMQICAMSKSSPKEAETEQRVAELILRTVQSLIGQNELRLLRNLQQNPLNMEMQRCGGTKRCASLLISVGQ